MASPFITAPRPGVRGRSRAALVACLLVSSAGPSFAADEPVADDWYAQFHQGRKAGWSHRRLLRSTEDGKPVWVTETEALALVEGTGKSTVTSSSRVVEDGEGRVLSYRSSVAPSWAKAPQVREGAVKDGVVRAMEDGKSREVPYPAGALGPAALDRAIAQRLDPGTEGKAIAFQTIDATGRPVSWKCAKSTELTNVLGRYMWLTPVERIDESGLPEVSLLGPGGREYAGANDLGVWQWFLTEEVVAKGEAEPSALLAPGVVAPDRAIPMSPRPVRALYRLSRKGRPVGDLPEGGAQRIASRGKDGSVDVEVRFVEPPSGTAIARPQPPRQETRRFLASTPLLELEHPRLKRFGEETIGGLINSLRSARMIELAVHGYLHAAPAETGFATACETISSATGDSTEAAVLAAGLARSVGVPSRIVAGFVYRDASTWHGEPMPRGAFAFHAWAEVHVAEGTWFPLDPMRMDGTLPQKNADELEGHGGFDATHIAVLVSDLDTKRPFTDICKPVLDFMDGLSIEVLEPR
jgi:hypothetical protein